jgi:hypothetical protein
MTFALLKLFSPPLDIEGLVRGSDCDCFPLTPSGRACGNFRAGALCPSPRMARYEVIDFLAVLFGYAISGERTLEAFYERLQPWASAFMALFGRDRLPARSTERPFSRRA